MSPELRKCLSDWLEWVERGAPEGEPFYRYEGLCRSVEMGAYELTEMFKKDGLNVGYPFGEDNYDARCEEGTQHEDPARLAWVREKLACE